MTDRRLLAPIPKLLLDAADYIEENGHSKGRLFGRRGGACILGAMLHASEADAVLVTSAEAYMCIHLDVHDIMWWNDRPARRKAQVVAALRDAAAAYVPT